MIKTRQRDSQTETKILNAARNVFVRRGTAGARMQDIAEEAGVNQALLHYYFRSKDGLAQAVFRDLVIRMVPSIVSIFAPRVALDRKIREFVHLYIDTVRVTPFIPGYILGELNFNPERVARLASDITGAPPGTVASSFIPQLRRQLEDEARAGRIRPISPEQFLVNLFSLCVFPFAARPMLRIVLGMEDDGFDAFLNERRDQLPGFILSALRP